MKPGMEDLAQWLESWPLWAKLLWAFVMCGVTVGALLRR